MSLAAPGGLGTIMWIARGGRSCALPASGISPKARISTTSHGERRAPLWLRRNSGSAPRPTLGRSRARIWILVKFTYDGRNARFGADEMITAIAIATQPPSMPQLIQSAGDLTSVIAADGLDNVSVKHRHRCQRLLDGLKASRAAEDLRRTSRQRNLAFPVERLGAVESRLGPGPPTVERGVHGHAKHSLKDDEVLIGLKPSSERPIDLPIVANIDILVEHVDVLEPHDSAEEGRDGRSGLSEGALLDRNAQGV